MAFLDRCYVSDMRLYRDRPDVLTRGRWYWCPPGAVPIPYFHVFGTHYQESDQHKIDPPVGEVPVRIKWSNGKGDRRYTGQQWCGNQDVWTHGALYSQRGTPHVDDFGVPPCCNPLPPDPGGVVVNGQSVFVSAPDESVRGGVLLGGVVRTQPTDGRPIRGGVLLGGLVATQQTVGRPIQGGVLLGGVVTTQPSEGRPIRGGVLLGGIVPTRSVPAGTVRGGVLLGGIVSTHGPPGGHGAGGVLLGGIVPTAHTPGTSSSGGVLLGGVVQTSQRPLSAGLGGVLLGGVVPTAGSGGILTSCCGATPTATHLYLRTRFASDPALNVTQDLVYDPGLALWVTPSFEYGVCEAQWTMRCFAGFGWLLEGNEFGASFATLASTTDCGPPFLVTFDAADLNAIMEGEGCTAPGSGPSVVEVSSVPF